MSLKESAELEELYNRVAKEEVLLKAYELIKELAKERFNIEVKKTASANLYKSLRFNK